MPRRGRSASKTAKRAPAAEIDGQAAQFVRLVDHSLSLSFLRDLDTGRLVYVNDRFEELLGYPRAQLTAPGFDLFALIAPDSLEKVRNSSEMHLRGEDHLPFEFTMLSRDGRRIEVILNSWVTVWEGRRAVVGIMTDITSQHRLAERLRLAKEDLERQNLELRALDRVKDGLLRDVSHELKTPVAKQAMQLEILRVQLGEACTGAVARTLGVMEEGIRRQQRVIRNLLDLARLESGGKGFRLGPVRADQVLERALEDYRPTLESAGFSIVVRAEPVSVTADEEMLWHVFSNLLNNAVKFAAREGPRRLEAAAWSENGRAAVRFADNGIGLAPEELKRVFERFYRASAAIEGSGVGLSICRSIMEGMGGTIVLLSPGRGHGAVVTVSLPLGPPA